MKNLTSSWSGLGYVTVFALAKTRANYGLLVKRVLASKKEVFNKQEFVLR